MPNIGALHRYKQNRLSDLDGHKTINDFIDESGGWNVNLQVALKIDGEKGKKER